MQWMEIKCNITVTKQSGGFYDDNHLLEKQLGEITPTAQDRRPALNLKKGENERVNKTTCSVKKGVNEKPIKLSDEGVENKYVKSQ